MIAIEQLCKHPVVMSCRTPNGAAKWKARGVNLAALIPLDEIQRSRANRKAARRNAREDAPYAIRYEARHGAGSAYDAGYAIVVPKMHPDRIHLSQVRRAVEIGGLPEDLRVLCQQFVLEHEAN